MTKRFGKTLFGRLAGIAAVAASLTVPVSAARADDVGSLQTAFDQTFGTQQRAPRSYGSPLEQSLAYLAGAEQGRIGVAALDLGTGRAVDVLGGQRFPMASTSKIAIAATFLEGVDRGRWSLTSEFPLMVAERSEKFSSTVAPVREGSYLPADQLIELMLTKSSNPATDALLRVVGGPRAVNDWARRAGVGDFRIDRDIATLVRDDGEVDPATTIDMRDSATPLAMVRLLTGLYQGEWLSPSSRSVLLGAMSRCATGKRRIPALLPPEALVAHKTGSLSNTSSDIGIINTPDGRAIAVAIYVTGQGSKQAREERIASIARVIYDGYMSEPAGYRRQASR